jgi:hypothetical protein
LRFVKPGASSSRVDPRQETESNAINDHRQQFMAADSHSKLKQICCNEGVNTLDTGELSVTEFHKQPTNMNCWRLSLIALLSILSVSCLGTARDETAASFVSRKVFREKYLERKQEEMIWNAEKNIRKSLESPFSDDLAFNSQRRLVEVEALTRKPTLSPTKMPANLPTTEIDGLYSFYNSTQGDQWRYSNVSELSIPWDWSENPVNPCYNHWQGIVCQCNHTNCNVLNVHLDSHFLNGSIPVEFTNLVQLESISLRSNFLTGTIPIELYQNMKQLNNLNLYSNFLNGTLPMEVQNLASLQVLDIGYNRFNGTVPETLYSLSKLQILYMGFNHFSGTISTALGQLKELRIYRIKLNLFNETFPFSSLFSLRNISVVDVSNNSFTGRIPSPLGENCCSELFGFDLGQNFFSGTIPEFSFHNLKKFVFASFNRNSLVGTIPVSVTNLTKLQWFSCEVNDINGTIPQGITQLRNLSTLLISQNIMTGTISAIAPLTQLSLLDVHSNGFHGQVHDLFLNFDNMYYFAMNNNFFTGRMPHAASNTSWLNLIYYLTTNNSFTGSIPYIASNNLRDFEIGENFITGPLPDFLLQDQGMTYLHVPQNLITGTIPVVPSGFTKDDLSLMAEFFVFSNYLSGPIPLQFTNLTRLVNLQVSYNYLTGTIPSQLFLSEYLQSFFLQYNLFTGSINIPRNVTSQLLASVDMSSNSLTGDLPYAIFHSSIQTFAACSNCFVGTISEEICSAKRLTALALDGLATAVNCRLPIFPSYFFESNSFILKESFQGGIPDCLFELPRLQTLHLSGNGLTGSLSSSLNISESISDLSLSHNIFTGPIPANIQNKSWNSLDLSSNKLDGILSANILANSSQDTTTLNLYVNHLSGSIPSGLKTMENLNILQGNLFACASSLSAKNDLPSSDPSANTYDCGSNLANESLYAYCILFSVIIVWILVTFILFKYSESRVLKRFPWIERTKQRILRKSKLFREWSDTLSMEMIRSPALSLTIHRFRTILSYVRWITLFTVIVFLPVFGVLSFFASTYTYKYAWTISSAFLSGTNAGIVLSVFFILYLFFVYYLLDDFFSDKNIEDENGKEGTKEKSINGKIQFEEEKELKDEPEKTEKEKVSYYHIMLWCFVGFLDIILMIVVNVLYILAVVNPITINFIVFLQLFLALFKVFWNDYVLWKLIPLVRYFGRTIQARVRSLYTSKEREKSKDKGISTSKEEFLYQLFYTDSSLSSSDLIFLLILILFNNIIAPFFSIAIISPDCFYYAFFAAANVDSSYSYCEYFLVIGKGDKDICEQEAVADTTYNPPYYYSYQCSSQLPVNYSPVYIYMFILVGFLQPLVKILMKFSYDSIWENHLKTLQLSNKSTKEGKETEEEVNGADVETGATGETRATTTIQRQDQSEIKGTDATAYYDKLAAQYELLLKTRFTFRMLDFLLPENMKRLKAVQEYERLFHERRSQRRTISFGSFRKKSSSERVISNSDGPNWKSYPSKDSSLPSLSSSTSNFSRFFSLENSSFHRNIDVLRIRRLFLRLFSYLGILLSFGTLFPPLAVIICLSIHIIIKLEETMIGRMIHEVNKEQSSLGSGGVFQWYHQQIQFECQSFQALSFHLTFIFLFLVGLIFSYILFDTVGNESGWESGIYPAIVLVTLPFLLWIFRWSGLAELLRKKTLFLLHRGGREKNEGEKDQHNEKEEDGSPRKVEREGIELSTSLSLTENPLLQRSSHYGGRPITTDKTSSHSRHVAEINSLKTLPGVINGDNSIDSDSNNGDMK